MKALAKVVVKNPILWASVLLCGIVIALPAIKDDDIFSGWNLGRESLEQSRLSIVRQNLNEAGTSGVPEDVRERWKDEVALLSRAVSTADDREYAELRAQLARRDAESIRSGILSGGAVEERDSEALFFERLAALPDPAIYENSAKAPAAWYLSNQSDRPLIIWMLPLLVASAVAVDATQGKRLLVQAPVSPLRMHAAQALLLLAISFVLLLAVCLPSFALQTVRAGIGDLSYPVVQLMAGVQFDETVGSVLLRQLGTYAAVSLLVLAIALAGARILRGRMAFAGVLIAGAMCASPLIAMGMQANVADISSLSPDASLGDPLVPFSAFAYLGEMSRLAGSADYWPMQDLVQDSRLSFGGGLIVLAGWAVVVIAVGCAAIAVRGLMAKRAMGTFGAKPVSTRSLGVVNLDLAFGKRTLLRHASLALNPGEIVGLIAPNGRGKTTLLEAIAGVGSARRAGSVSADGVALGDTAAFRGQVLYVPCEAALLYPNLTAADHIKIAASLWPGKVDTGKLIALCQLEGYLNRPVRAYSSGMKQQLALAVAYCTGVRCLLLDEPMNALDPGNVSLNSYILKRLASNGTGILFSSHILSNVDELCEAVIAIEGEKLVRHDLGADGPRAREVYDAAFGASYHRRDPKDAGRQQANG